MKIRRVHKGWLALSGVLFFLMALWTPAAIYAVVSVKVSLHVFIDILLPMLFTSVGWLGVLLSARMITRLVEWDDVGIREHSMAGWDLSWSRLREGAPADGALIKKAGKLKPTAPPPPEALAEPGPRASSQLWRWQGLGVAAGAWGLVAALTMVVMMLASGPHAPFYLAAIVTAVAAAALMRPVRRAVFVDENGIRALGEKPWLLHWHEIASATVIDGLVIVRRRVLGQAVADSHQADWSELESLSRPERRARLLSQPGVYTAEVRASDEDGVRAVTQHYLALQVPALDDAPPPQPGHWPVWETWMAAHEEGQRQARFNSRPGL